MFTDSGTGTMTRSFLHSRIVTGKRWCVYKFKDLGLIPERYWRACSVISIEGRVFPQAIIFHLTSNLEAGEVSSVVELEGSKGLFCPASSGKVSLRIEGGLNSMELEVSVPRRDLLGVSGFIIDWSPPVEPNIILGRDAAVVHRGPRAFLAFLLGLEFSLSPQPSFLRLWLP